MTGGCARCAISSVRCVILGARCALPLRDGIYFCAHRTAYELSIMKLGNPAPACISSFHFNNEEKSFAFVSRVAVCAVGVDPTESTSGVSCEETVSVHATTGVAISAASLTACNSAEIN